LLILVFDNSNFDAVLLLQFTRVFCNNVTSIRQPIVSSQASAVRSVACTDRVWLEDVSANRVGVGSIACEVSGECAADISSTPTIRSSTAFVPGDCVNETWLMCYLHEFSVSSWLFS